MTPEIDGIGIYPCSIDARGEPFIGKAGRSR
jgi:hypothetical protein